ncbi:MAG: serine/threonine protein kinase [Planctomycetes bacterium]|nr:serine/threonine protein kinase [Planctomycetota bacterium]
MADPLNLVGKTFAGYAVEKKVGAGGMGVVFRAFDERLRRVVALKILPPSLARDEETRLRFLREGRTAAKIDHTNAVRLLAAGEEKGLAYLVMEFVDAGSLQQRIDRFKRLAPGEVISVARQLALALGAGHKLGILHRDVKPANVLFTRDGDAKLADYGLAKEEACDVSLSMTGMVMGTPHYMAPEVCEGKKGDARSDLYALGVMMYYMASGNYPFDGTAVMQVLMAHVQDVAPPIENAPAALSEIIDRLMAKDPAARYQNAEQLVAALDVAARDPETSLAGARPAQSSGVRPPSNASADRSPSATGATSPSSLPGRTAPLSIVAPLPTPQWHFAAYAVAGMAFLLSAALLIWVFTRDKGHGAGEGNGGGGNAKIEQKVDPAALAHGELVKKWTAFQARARQDGADLGACLGQVDEFTKVDPAGVERLRGDLLARFKIELLARIQKRSEQLVTDAGHGVVAALSEAAMRDKWPDVPFAEELKGAEEAVEVRVWNAYFDKLTGDAAGNVASGEYRLALEKWDHVSPPKTVGRSRIELERKDLLAKARDAADRATENAHGAAGAKALKELALRMPKDIGTMLEQKAFDIEQAEDTEDPLAQLPGMLAARNFEGVLRQLDILDASGKVKNKAKIERARTVAESGKRVIARAMESWRARTGKPVEIQRADATVEKGVLFEVADAGDQLTLETSHGQAVLTLDSISPRSFSEAAMGAAPGNGDVQDAFNFALAVRDRSTSVDLFRRLVRRGVPPESWQKESVLGLLPADLVKEAGARFSSLQAAAPGPEAAEAARTFLDKFRAWPMRTDDRLLVERVLAAGAQKFLPSDMDLIVHGAVESAADGTVKLTWTDDLLLEDVLLIGGVEVSGGEGFTLTPKDKAAVLVLPFWKWKDPKIRLEAKSSQQFYAIMPAWRTWSEGLPSFLSLHDGLHESGILPPTAEQFSPVPTREDGWNTVEIAVTGSQYSLSINGAASKTPLPHVWDGAVGIVLTSAMTIRSLSISGKPAWLTDDVEAVSRELSALLAENNETSVNAGQWQKTPTKENLATVRADDNEAFLRPPSWSQGADYIVRFNAAASGKGTTEKWPELVLDFRCAGKIFRRFYLSGSSRAGYVAGDRWMTAGLAKDVPSRESHDVALIVKGEWGMLVVDGEVAWIGHTGPATAGGPAIGVKNGLLEVKDLRVRALNK